MPSQDSRRPHLFSCSYSPPASMKGRAKREAQEKHRDDRDQQEKCAKTPSPQKKFPGAQKQSVDHDDATNPADERAGEGMGWIQVPRGRCPHAILLRER